MPIESNVQSVQALDDLLSQRFSCRAFRPDPVPRTTIEEILRLAQKTASWCNTQPWKLWVTEGSETERLRQALHARASQGLVDPSDVERPREYRGVYLERRRASGGQLYQALGIGRKDLRARNEQLLENFRFFGAPHFALVTTDEALGPYGVLDCGGFVANFLLAARACGVDSIPQAAVSLHSAFLREWFGVPDTRWVVCGISFGYAARSHPANSYRAPRASIEEAVSWRGA